ncbi:hypothetical protein BDQ17DRAFT_1330700 [Cyathus striatus]|nr:hypothetical protein BDQ17DRAFT_1330700 [Cyathus striatus]
MPLHMLGAGGAVAGVFSVVGIVVLAIIIALLTNTIRRRRAKKFDREIEEAARDAATARPPDFLDDDDEHDNYYRGAGFSDVSSHGTYAQPPMGVESYGMREMGPPVPGIPAQGGVSGSGGSGPAPGEIFDPSRLYADGAAGAAGIGVARARSMGGGAGAALREGGSPYAAFAGPNPALVPHGHAHEVYSAGSSGASRDLLEAAGIVPGIGAGAGLVRGASQYQRDGNGQQGSYAQYETPGLDRSRSLGTGLNQVQPPPQRELDRSKSMGAGLSLSQPTSASTDYYSPQAESYNSHQAPQYQNFGGSAQQQQQQKQPSQYSPPAQYQPPNYTQGRNSFAYDEEDAYGGFDNAPPASQSQNGHVQGKRQSVGMPNPYSATGVPPPEFRPEAGRGSESDYEEEEEPRRVLKVANA